MPAPVHTTRRQGCVRNDGMYILTLMILVVIAIASVQVLFGPQGDFLGGEEWGSWKGRLTLLVRVLGGFIAIVLLLNVRELLGLGRDVVAQMKLQRKLSWLNRLLHNTRGQATEANLRAVLSHLRGSDSWTLQHHALGASYCLVRADPSLTRSVAGYRPVMERMVFLEPGFARTLHEAVHHTSLPQLITLGAKIGAGTIEKRISPVTSDPLTLARWVFSHRDPGRHQELQVAIGYDTGSLPYQEERGKFLALYLFITSTDLTSFQALTRQPTRDPNAAYGLLIRGDRIEVKFPGQQPGRRLDFVFPCPRQMSLENLGHFLRGIQLLSLGLLLASVEDSCRVFFPEDPLGWLTPPMRRAAAVYRDFERSFIALLRQYDGYRDPGMIFPLDPTDHVERVNAFLRFRLEECLYPTWKWVVPLYGEDIHWDELVPTLRGIEALMLHQGKVPEKSITRGLSFIQQVRLLGYQSIVTLEEALSSTEEMALPTAPASFDPFIQPLEDREATLEYLQRMARMLELAQLGVESLPDPIAFRKALAYYDMALAGQV